MELLVRINYNDIGKIVYSLVNLTCNEGCKKCILYTIFKKIELNRQMTCQQYKLRFEPRNPISHVSAGPYFLSLFSEHPVVFSNKRLTLRSHERKTL